MAPPSLRPTLSITLPPNWAFPPQDGTMPKTPEQQDRQQSASEPPPPPRPQAFKVKRKRATILPEFSNPLGDAGVIPTIEMSEVPTDLSSPIFQRTPSAHLLSPMPNTLPRALTPPMTPAPRNHTVFSQLESPAREWDLINKTKAPFERSGSVCSSFSDSSISSCGTSDFSLPTAGNDSPVTEVSDPFLDDESTKRESLDPPPQFMDYLPKAKRVKTRRDVKWTPVMDDHLWMTFMAYLSDPTLTPFKMLPGSTPPMGVCDQVASKAKRTWHQRKATPMTAGSIDAWVDVDRAQREGSPDTIRPSSVQTAQHKWPKVAATRRRLRELCVRRPSISAHYQRMLRTRSPSPFETSSPVIRFSEPPSSVYSSHDLRLSLVTSTAPSMQPEGPLAQLATDEPLPLPRTRTASRPERPSDWFARIPRSKAHQKSASLQSTLQVNSEESSHGNMTLASPFASSEASHRTHLLHSMAATKSLGRTEFNGKALESPFEFGAPTAPRSRKRRFRSDEEKPRRPALEDVFGPMVENDVGRSRGFSVDAARATDNLSKLFTPVSSSTDYDMTEAPGPSNAPDEIPFGCRSAPRRLAEPVPRLGSPFTESLFQNRQSNTFPRRSLIPTAPDQKPFHQRLKELAAEHEIFRGN